ncbi:MAG: chorismate mutase [Candidatus Natronoplasma sp.]
MERIHEHRNRIDQIDEEILKLLEERVAVAKEIGKIKREKGISITDTYREKVVLDRADRHRDVFEKIIKTCKEEE